MEGIIAAFAVFCAVLFFFLMYCTFFLEDYR